MRVIWSPRALRHLREIERYIADDDPAAAHRLRRRIVQRVASLARTPYLGRPGRVVSTRELVITQAPYIVAYTVNGEHIEVLAVLHTARDWPERFDEG